MDGFVVLVGGCGLGSVSADLVFLDQEQSMI